MIFINKFDITLHNGNIISLYFNTINEALDYANRMFNKSEKPLTKDHVEIDTKLEYTKYIKEIIDDSEGSIDLWVKKHYLYKTNKGLVPVNIWQEKDGFYYNGLQYIEGRYNKEKHTIESFKGSYTSPFGWTFAKPKEFLELYKKENELQFTHHQIRFYGQPKLKKPKELKGIKQAFSVDYIPKKCKCQIFIKDSDVWIKHKDYFSSSMITPIKDAGTPLSYRCKKYLSKIKNESFVYPDTWGVIVLRNEAWICIKNLFHRIKLNEFEPVLVNQILRQQEKECNFKRNELENTTMSRFWESLIGELKKYYKEGN